MLRDSILLLTVLHYAVRPPPHTTAFLSAYAFKLQLELAARSVRYAG